MKKIAALCAIVLILLISLTSCIQINRNSSSTESDRKIHTYRELTDREQFLSARIEEAIIEMSKIYDCEVAVMFDEPIHVLITMTLESNVKHSDFTDMDMEAVYTIVSNISMNYENVIISEENITIGYGELE